MTTADVNDRDGAELMFLLNADGLARVENVVVDGGYTGARLEHQVYDLLGATAEFAKRNELHKFVIIPKRCVVKRSFGWIEKWRRLWKNCERKLHTSEQFVVLAFFAFLLKRH